MFPFYMMLTKCCEKLKVVSTVFHWWKTAPSFLSSLPIKLICSFKSGFSNSVCLLKSIGINWWFEKYSPINYRLCNHYSCSFQSLLQMFLLCFLLAHQKTLAIKYIEVLYFNTWCIILWKRHPIIYILNGKTNNLLTSLNAWSIK